MSSIYPSSIAEALPDEKSVAEARKQLDAAGVGGDRTGQRLGGVEGRDADGVVDQFGFGVQDLLAGVDLGEWEPFEVKPQWVKLWGGQYNHCTTCGKCWSKFQCQN